MPELPEVETIARDLRARIVGDTIREVWTSGKALRLARPIDVESIRRIALGGRVASVRRTGKYLLIDVEPPSSSPSASPSGRSTRGTNARATGPASGVLIHLGMSGRLQVEEVSAPRLPHTHVVFRFAGGHELRFRDPRRFGWMAASDRLDGSVELSSLGPDPLSELTVEHLARALVGVRAPVKAFLLDQSRVAGLGNIYVCEALFRARVHPTAPAGRVVSRAPALLDGIRGALSTGIENRGTTLRDYVDSFGSGGNNATSLQVYGRAGEACVVCARPIRRRVDAGRSTFYCATCQRW